MIAMTVFRVVSHIHGGLTSAMLYLISIRAGSGGIPPASRMNSIADKAAVCRKTLGYHCSCEGQSISHGPAVEGRPKHQLGGLVPEFATRLSHLSARTLKKIRLISNQCESPCYSMQRSRIASFWIRFHRLTYPGNVAAPP